VAERTALQPQEPQDVPSVVSALIKEAQGMREEVRQLKEAKKAKVAESAQTRDAAAQQDEMDAVKKELEDLKAEFKQLKQEKNTPTDNEVGAISQEIESIKNEVKVLKGEEPTAKEEMPQWLKDLKEDELRELVQEHTKGGQFHVERTGSKDPVSYTEVVSGDTDDKNITKIKINGPSASSAPSSLSSYSSLTPSISSMAPSTASSLMASNPISDGKEGGSLPSLAPLHPTEGYQLPSSFINGSALTGQLSSSGASATSSAGSVVGAKKRLKPKKQEAVEMDKKEGEEEEKEGEEEEKEMDMEEMYENED